MENELFLNNGIPLPPPPIQLEPIPSSLIPTWATSFIEMQKNNNSFLPNWEKSTEFDSALSSLVSSPAASNSTLSNSNFMIRELIGKLGNIGTETSSHSHPMIPTSYIPNTGNNTPNTCCYSTPLNSPPRANLRQIIGQLQEKSLGFSGLDADPAFVERAARFSGFGSRSFNGRTNQLGLDNTNLVGCNGGSPLMGSGDLSRVSSSPSLEAIGSQKSSNELNSRKRKAASRGKAKELTANLVKDAEINDNSDTKRGKSNEGNGNDNIHSPVKAEEDSKGSGDDDSNPTEPPKDYIRVRARRGQATDSHSLAERVRREKISERMKLLQALVPGCNKVTGKALMLDEIINYVQSLQRQVEFLSMKLASVNSTRLDFNMDTITSKHIFQSNYQLPHPLFPLDSTVSSIFGHQPLQSQVLCSNISNGSVPLDQLDTLLCPNPSLQLPQVDAFNPSVHLYSTLCEGDLQTIVQMGLGQNLR